MMASAQVVETSVNVTTNSPCQDYTHPDDHNLPTYVYSVSRTENMTTVNKFAHFRGSHCELFSNQNWRITFRKPVSRNDPANGRTDHVFRAEKR